MRKQSQSKLDLSFANAARLLPPAYAQLRLILVGCGGNGSWLAPSIARIAKVLQEKGTQIQVLFYDHDKVEHKNIPRQNFCKAELGRNKAQTLAARFTGAWGVEIVAVPAKFQENRLRPDFNALSLIIGCVDNSAARQQIAKSLEWNQHTANKPMVWWLDCGNDESSGQVLLGSSADRKALGGAFVSRRICKSLPAPSLLAPDLLVPRPEELVESKLSCAEIQMANDQSLAVNQMVASVATDYLLRFCFGGLKRFATYFDLESGSARSRYITPEEIAGVIKKPVDFLIEPRRKGK